MMEEDGDFDDDDGMSRDVPVKKRKWGEREKNRCVNPLLSRRSPIWRAVCVLNEHLSRQGNRLLVSTVNLGSCNFQSRCIKKEL